MSAGPLNFVMQLVEQQAGQVLQQYQNQLLQLVNKPEVLATLTQLTQLAQGNFVQNVKDVLINMINKVLNNQSPAQARIEAQQELQAQLQRFSLDLGSIAQNLLNNSQVTNVLNNLLNQVNIPSNIVDSLLNIVVSQGKRDAADFFLNQLGIGAVWDTIKQLGQGFVAQIISIGTQLLFVGSQKWEQAKIIFAQMVQDLTNHVGDASTIVANSIAAVNQVLNNTVGKRDLLSAFAQLGLNQVIQNVQALGGQLSTQLTQLATQVLLAGQEKWNAAKLIFAQLAQDLQSHTFDALPYIQNAVQKLKELLKGQSQKRDLVSTALNALGVNDLLQSAQQAGAAAYAQLVATLVGLIGQGKEVLAQAKQVLAQLVEDLKNHTANASTLVQQASSNLAALLAGQGKRDLADFLATLGFNQVVQTAQEAGAAAVAQLTSLATQALFAGKQKLDKVKQVFAQLVEDLKNHTANASTLVQNAVSTLNQVLQGKPQLKRDLVATAMNIFQVNQIVQTLQGLAGDLKNQFLSTVTQLLFAGQQAVAQAQGIFAQLVQDLKDHAGNSVPLVQQAIAQLTQVIASQSGKRGLNDFVFNALGLNQVVSTIQSLAGDLKNQFMTVATQLLFAGQQAIAQAQGILAQLVQDLKDHAGNAVPLVQQAVAQLTQVVASQAGKRGLNDMIFNAFGLNQVVETVQGLAGDLKNQFLSTITALFFAGQQAVAQAQGILAQLVQDLKDHAGNAVPLVQQAVAQLTQVVASQAGKRGLNDMVFNVFGLNSVIQSLQGLAGDLKNQFLSVATQLLFAGQQAVAQAQAIFADLVQNLKDHAGNAVPLVQQAVAQLTQVLANSGNF